MHLIKAEFEVEDRQINENFLLATSSAISKRISEVFPDTDAFHAEALRKATPEGFDQLLDVDYVRHQ